MIPLDLTAIRRDAADGLPVLPATVVALCDEVQRLRADVSALHAAAVAVIGSAHEEEEVVEVPDAMYEALLQLADLLDARPRVPPLLALLSAARAYLTAVDRLDGIVEAEQALRRAVEGCKE